MRAIRTYAHNRDWNADENFDPAPASGIGDPRVVEYIPQMYTISLTVASMALKKDSLFSVGVFPEGIDKYLATEPFTVVVVDKVSQKIIRQYNNCIFGRGTLSIRKHTIVSHNCTLMATEALAGDAAGFIETSA